MITLTPATFSLLSHCLHSHSHSYPCVLSTPSSPISYLFRLPVGGHGYYVFVIARAISHPEGSPTAPLPFSSQSLFLCECWRPELGAPHSCTAGSHAHWVISSPILAFLYNSNTGYVNKKCRKCLSIKLSILPDNWEIEEKRITILYLLRNLHPGSRSSMIANLKNVRNKYGLSQKKRMQNCLGVSTAENQTSPTNVNLPQPWVSTGQPPTSWETGGLRDTRCSLD